MTAQCEGGRGKGKGAGTSSKSKQLQLGRRGAAIKCQAKVSQRTANLMHGHKSINFQNTISQRKAEREREKEREQEQVT